MFQKSKINEPIDPRAGGQTPVSSPVPAPSPRPAERPAVSERPAPGGLAQSSPSVIAPDLKVIGNLMTDGDLQIEGTVEGDVQARMLVVGNNAHVKGEIRSTDVTVNGKVTGRIRGQKVRLSATARVDGDIVHSSLAMEEGADFEGSIHRGDDPLKDSVAQPKPDAQVMELTSPAKTGTDKPG